MKTLLEKEPDILNIATGSYMLFKSPNYVDFSANGDQLVAKLGVIYRDKCATIMNDERVFHFTSALDPGSDILDRIEPIHLTKEWIQVLTTHIPNGHRIFVIAANGEVQVNLNREYYTIRFVHHLQAIIEMLKGSVLNFTSYDKEQLQKSLNIKII
jgi:hypothetical protein